MSTRNICYLLRNNGFSGKIIVGGHLSFNYNELLEFSDFVVIGEGEISTINLLNSIQKKTNIKNVNGIAFKNKNKVIVTPKKFIHDIDNLPFPAWHLFPPLIKYKNFCRKKPDISILTSRGCPFNCIYCSSSRILGKKFRIRSPKNVIDEIEFLVEQYDAKELSIQDDSFSIDRKRVEKICDLIINRNIDIIWKCDNGLRAETLTRRLLKKMKNAGCYFIAIGAETGNQEVANKIQRNQDLNVIRKAAKLIKDEGIIFKVFFQIGLPFDNPKTMRDTIEFAKELDPDIAQFTITTPLTGTKLYELIEDEGVFLFDESSKGFYGGRVTYEIFDLKAKDVEKAYKQAYREFYSPWKFFSMLTKSKAWEEFKYYLNTGRFILKSLYH